MFSWTRRPFVIARLTFSNQLGKSPRKPKTIAAIFDCPLGCYRVASGNPLRAMLSVPLVGSDGPAVRKMIDPTQSNNPLFDFADARNRVYQCTLSPSSHRYDCVHLARLLFMVNYERLNDAPPVDDDGNPTCPLPVHFVWLIPRDGNPCTYHVATCRLEMENSFKEWLQSIVKRCVL